MDENIGIILDMFPSMAIDDIKSSLSLHNNNVEDTINHLLTTPVAVADDNNNEHDEDDDEEKKNEQLLRDMLKAEQEQLDKEHQSKTYYCSICYDDLMIDQFYIIDECEHRFCVGCLRHHYQSQIQMRFPYIKCPQLTCPRKVSYVEVKHILSDEEFVKYDKLLLDCSLQKDKNLVYCPYPDCGSAMIVPTGEEGHVECTNNECGHNFCLKCRDEHYGYTCQEIVDLREYIRENTYVAKVNVALNDGHAIQNLFWMGKGRKWKKTVMKIDKRLGSYLANNTRMCPTCHIIIEKDGGCNDMDCAFCHHRFCFGCGIDITTTHVISANNTMENIHAQSCQDKG
ncbi:hypothetical protein SAMD00019534_027310, partial [Acytostelium subglobosum LB1]|uniref:hypothetical protein n=1 Tax=Acytostelium subglobosum LB1 TaxID=1410327 RepID=UPI000644B610